MGIKGTKDLTKEEYQECCGTIKDILDGQKNTFKTEVEKKKK